MTIATHQPKGQRWGRVNGNHGTQKPARVGTTVRSDVPGVTGVLSDHPSSALGLSCGIDIRRQILFTHDPPNRRGRQPEPGPGQERGHASGSHGWTQHLELADEMPDELRIAIDRLAFHRLLCQHAGTVVVSNPPKTRVIAEAKVKTDKVDAEILARLLSADFLPPVWVPDAFHASPRHQVTRGGEEEYERFLVDRFGPEGPKAVDHPNRPQEKQKRNPIAALDGFKDKLRCKRERSIRTVRR